MASRTLLLGIVPVCTQTPPIISVRSMTATRLRSLAAQMAPFWPAGPLPITIRSKFCSLIGNRPVSLLEGLAAIYDIHFPMQMLQEYVQSGDTNKLMPRIKHADASR